MAQRFSLEEVLDVVKAYIKTHGYPPTNRELAEELDCSLSTVNEYLRKMMHAGMLETDHPFGSCRAFRVAGMRMVDIRELKGAVKQLEDLLEHCRDMAAGRDPDPIWIRDVKALETVIEAIRTKRKQDGTNH